MGEILAFVFIGLLVLAGLVLGFLIDIYLGIGIFTIVAASIGYVYGVRKRRVDRMFTTAAAITGLFFHRHPIRYGVLEGEYKGAPTEVRILNRPRASLGSILVPATGHAALAALDTGAAFVVRMQAPASASGPRVIRRGFPLIVRNPDHFLSILPSIPSQPDGIVGELDRLARSLGAEAAPDMPSRARK